MHPPIAVVYSVVAGLLVCYKCARGRGAGWRGTNRPRPEMHAAAGSRAYQCDGVKEADGRDDACHPGTLDRALCAANRPCCRLPLYSQSARCRPWVRGDQLRMARVLRRLTRDMVDLFVARRVSPSVRSRRHGPLRRPRVGRGPARRRDGRARCASAGTGRRAARVTVGAVGAVAAGAIGRRTCLQPRHATGARPCSTAAACVCRAHCERTSCVCVGVGVRDVRVRALARATPHTPHTRIRCTTTAATATATNTTTIRSS